MVATSARKRLPVVVALGCAQVIAWGTTYYLLAVLGTFIARDTGWSGTFVTGIFSWALLVSALIVPHVGRIIDRLGGRRILAASSLLIAAGLATLGLATNPMLYVVAWTLIGVGMAAGLYDAAFATLGRLYGETARRSISGITLFAGFASTLAWPMTAVLQSMLGWRGTCFAYAVLHLTVSLPLYLLMIPEVPKLPYLAEPALPTKKSQGDAPDIATLRRIAILLTFAFACQAFVMSALSVHVLDLLRRFEVSTADVIVVGALIGVAQVGGRILELGVLHRLHPIWVARLATSLLPASVAVLLIFGPSAALLFAILYGAGNGLVTITRGTLPLALFGAAGYGARLGNIARPIQVTQAAGPLLFALTLERVSAPLAFGIAGLLGFFAVATFIFLRPPPSEGAPR